MELRQLRYFVTVAEELHFGRAAERLGIVQPAVSQQVARLEREFGLQLLDRSSRHVRLTNDGERLLREARAVLAAADRTTEVAAELVSGRGSLIRIGTAPGLRDRLERGLAVLATDGEIKLVAGTPAEHLAALRTGELDLAFVRGEVTAPDLTTIELWREPISVLAPTAYRSDDGVKPADLAEVPLRLPPDPWLREQVLAVCREAGIEPVLGRPADNIEHVVIEMSVGTPSWTVVYGTSCGSGEEAVWLGPLVPALSAPGQLVAVAGQSAHCLDVVAEAFR
ncbi:LysR family transcriptional regulator [Kribbella sp. NPDC056951]|uniref:LysR family transcriptional regulator n=1 Tax=Kribbella sp. NPDC056951 TaxID=3345978 RepID=UPI003625BE81